MYRVVSKRALAEEIYRLEVEAPRIAQKRKAGQFVIVRGTADGERLPLTICDADPDAGTITLIIQTVGASSHQVCAIEEGEALHDVAGPLGKPTDIEKVGLCVCVGGGVGTAPMYPIAKALKEAGNELIGIVGARSKDLLILTDEVAAISDELLIATDDGSAGHKGFVSDVLAEVLANRKVDLCVAIGPVMMMRACAEVTRPAGVHTIVSLNPIMIDGTGMCGGCRVTVGGKTKFACVDGPEFDGHQVDFAELARRLAAYRDFEGRRHEEFHEECRIGLKT